MDANNMKKLSQSLSAKQMADILEAGSSKDRDMEPPKRQGSPTKTTMVMARQNPVDLKRFRPPLGRSKAVPKPVREVTAPVVRTEAGKPKRPAVKKGSPFYVPSSLDFEDLQPGGKKDKRMKGLSGAQKKWYRRALLEGKSPECALLAAKDRGGKTIPVTKASKRELSDESRSATAQTSKFPRTEKGGAESRRPAPQLRHPKEDIAEQVEGIEMCVLRAEYPEVLLTKGEMEVIEKHIIEQIIKGWRDKIRLDYFKHGPGYINTKAADATTAEWLRQAIWGANIKLGMNLKVAVGNEIPRSKLVTMFFPKSEGITKEDILKGIKSSNDLDTERWQVAKEELVEGKGKTLKVLIDEHQQRKLVALKHTIRFLFYTIKVHGARSKTATDEDEGNTPKEGPIADFIPPEKPAKEPEGEAMVTEEEQPEEVLSLREEDELLDEKDEEGDPARPAGTDIESGPVAE